LGGATPDEALKERREDRQAAGYKQELDTLTRRITADMARLRFIIHQACPDRPKHLATVDMTAVQLVADGWCPSCFRDDQHLSPISIRPSTGEPYYRDRCRPCGEWKAANREDPPLEVLRTRHRGGRVRIKTA
jgi:hypothetical protein